MAKQTISVGTSPNDGTGDTLRTAGQKINSNFTEVYNTSQAGFDKANSSLSLAQAAFDQANSGGGGGEVNGNISITSTNSAINFAPNSSGDGVGYSTIQLLPDTNTTQDQYIIIDPTAPSHIHVRAGGTQDSSSAELYLGGERRYVRINDGSGIRIQDQNDTDDTLYYSDPSDYTSGIWFELDGGYYVQFTATNPLMGQSAFDFVNNTDLNELTVYYDGGAVSNTLTSAGSASNLGGGAYRVGVNEAPPANNTVLTTMDFRLFTTNTNYLRLEYNDFEVSVRDDIRLYGRDTFRLMNYSSTDPIEIFTNYDDQEYRWAFNSDGTMTFPDDTLQLTASNPGFRAVNLINTVSHNAANNEEILLCDPNSTGSDIQVNLSTNVSDGKIFTIKNINPGGYSVNVAATTIEDPVSKTIVSEVVMANTGEVYTWIAYSGTYRHIG